VSVRERYLYNAKVLIAAVPVLAAGTGCYEYQQAPSSALHPGQSVHVELTPTGSSSLVPTIGPNAQGIDGKIITSDATRLSLAATQIVRTVGPEEFLRDEPISIPANGFGAVTIRQLDKPRTILATALIIGGVILAQVVANQTGIFNNKNTPSQGTK
jgi:hypothetical protein